MKIAIWVFLIAFLVIDAAPGASIIVGVAMVVDGDTIDVAGTRIRLHGIDAPEDRASRPNFGWEDNTCNGTTSARPGTCHNTRIMGALVLSVAGNQGCVPLKITREADDMGNLSLFFHPGLMSHRKWPCIRHGEYSPQ